MALERKREPGMTVEEFFDLIENDPDHRYEYIDGEVYMMTGGKRRDALLANNVGRILGNLLQSKPCLVFNADACVQLSETRYVCPDVAVSCDPRDGDTGSDLEEDDKLVRYPCLVVEVLSPATKSRDRGKKVQIYQDCPTIQDYLIVDSESPTVWHYQRQENGEWTVQMLHLENSIEFISIGARCSVAEIYEKTQFSKQS
jgi:Uma2 family endonuclease